jgi:hypothetical protein
MRIVGGLSLALCALTFLPGCTGESSPETKAKVERAKEKVREAVPAVLEAAGAKRDEYLKEMNRQLAALDVKMADLKEQTEKSAGEARQKLERKLEEAKVKHADAARKLEDLKAASADRWEKLKGGMSKAYEDLKKVIE